MFEKLPIKGSLKWQVLQLLAFEGQSLSLMEVDLGFLKICLMVLSMMWEGNELRLRVSDSLLRSL